MLIELVNLNKQHVTTSVHVEDTNTAPSSSLPKSILHSIRLHKKKIVHSTPSSPSSKNNSHKSHPFHNVLLKHNKQHLALFLARRNYLHQFTILLVYVTHILQGTSVIFTSLSAAFPQHLQHSLFLSIALATNLLLSIAHIIQQINQALSTSLKNDIDEILASDGHHYCSETPLLTLSAAPQSNNSILSPPTTDYDHQQ